MATSYPLYRHPATAVPRAAPPVLSVGHSSAKRARKAALHQLSIYGCRLASAIRAAEGEALTVRFDSSDPVAATVVWCEGGVIAARFDHPIERDMARKLNLRIA